MSAYFCCYLFQLLISVLIPLFFLRKKRKDCLERGQLLRDGYQFYRPANGYITKISTLTAGFGWKEREVTRYYLEFAGRTKCFERPAPEIPGLKEHDLIEVRYLNDGTVVSVPLFDFYDLNQLYNSSKKKYLAISAYSLIITTFLYWAYTWFGK